jgi:hypothetical protein
MQGARVLVALAGFFLWAAKPVLGQATLTPEFEVASVRAAARVPGQRPVPARRSGGPGTTDLQLKTTPELLAQAADRAGLTIQGAFAQAGRAVVVTRLTSCRH